MARLTPDPTFYPSPGDAMQAPREQLAYVVTLNTGTNGTAQPDGLCVLDVDPTSATFAQMVGRTDMPNTGDELHHFGWNACSSALCPTAPHPHVERRYLVVPGLRSSRIHILDTKPDPRQPKLIKVIEPDELTRKTGYSRPHTTHCGPDGIYMNALGNAQGDGPGGIFVLDHENFSVKGAWEVDRGPQYLAYDFWWHLGHDTMITSEWGTPNMVESGVNPELFGKYGHQLHVWNLRTRRHMQSLDLGAEQQMVLELRPSHDPNKTYGFVGVVVSLQDLSSSIWTWYRDGSAVLRAVPAIAIGHEASIGAVALLVATAQVFAVAELLRPVGAISLVAFGLFKLVRPRSHPRWVGMRIGPRELVVWSFLMSSAHGAGLMLLPVLLGLPVGADTPDLPRLSLSTQVFAQDVLAIIVHTSAMLLVMGTVAFVVYERLGVGFLRRRWLNVDLLWSVAVIGAGVVTLFT